MTSLSSGKICHFCGELWPCLRDTTGYGLVQEEGLSCPVGLVWKQIKPLVCFSCAHDPVEQLNVLYETQL